MGPVRVMVVLAGLVFLQACGYTLTSPATNHETPIDHTLSGIAFKIFETPIKRLRMAALGALRRMDMTVIHDRKGRGGWNIKAVTETRVVNIEFETLNKRLTRMRVIVNKDGLLFKDKDTGTEIISRTAARLKAQAALPQGGVPLASSTLPAR